jgi:FkbH-like protein
MPLSPVDGREAATKIVKVLVWDLDNTLWVGRLAEGDDVQVKPEACKILRLLDTRGILHSVASKNDHDQAMAKLKEVGLEEYFLYPQINWNAKSNNIRVIASSINVGLDAIAFLDDEPYEREEVKHSLPEVTTIDAGELRLLSERPEFTPRFVTEDAARRREMYRAAMQRNLAEQEFTGPNEEFLATLDLEYTIGRLQEEDLERAEELTIRTHQLNTTGSLYTRDELNAFRRSAEHLSLVISLRDRFGTYGKVGLALVEKTPARWTIKLFLVSCRVMSLAPGTVMINHLLQLAHAAGADLEVEFLANQRNRMMLLTLKGAGFRDVRHAGNFLVLRHDPSSAARADWLKYTTSEWLTVQRHPEWVKVRIAD